MARVLNASVVMTYTARWLRDFGATRHVERATILKMLDQSLNHFVGTRDTRQDMRISHEAIYRSLGRSHVTAYWVIWRMRSGHLPSSWVRKSRHDALSGQHVFYTPSSKWNSKTRTRNRCTSALLAAGQLRSSPCGPRPQKPSQPLIAAGRWR
jgi:hypothetical protein